MMASASVNVWDLESSSQKTQAEERPNLVYGVQIESRIPDGSPPGTNPTYGIRVIGVANHVKGGLKGNFISNIQAGSSAAKCDNLQVGDEIISVNGVDARDMVHAEMIAELKQAAPPLQLSLRRNISGWTKYKQQSEMLARAPTLKANNGRLSSSSTQVPAADVTEVHLSTVSNLNEEASNVERGLVCFRRGDFKQAEACFLDSLHAEVDADMTNAIVEASRQSSPAKAQTAMNRAVEMQRKKKGGVNYLVGIAIAAQGHMQRAQRSLALAVKQCMEWMYTEGMPIDVADAEFHHAIGKNLVTQRKWNIAAVAFREATKRRPANQEWRNDLIEAIQKLNVDTARAKLYSGEFDDSSNNDNDNENANADDDVENIRAVRNGDKVKLKLKAPVDLQPQTPFGSLGNNNELVKSQEKLARAQLIRDLAACELPTMNLESARADNDVNDHNTFEGSRSQSPDDADADTDADADVDTDVDPENVVGEVKSWC
eukprot:m.206315 g.206315  ORF g.206315 m.206315 type:complete len:487 (+) comp32949_c0_seq2:271-1731(+)